MIKVPISIFVPWYKGSVKIANGCKLRQITKTELEEYFNTNCEFDDEQRPQKIFPLKDRLSRHSYYNNLFPIGSNVHEIGIDAFLPYFVIEIDAPESFYNLNFLLRLHGTQEFIAPFGFAENQVVFSTH